MSISSQLLNEQRKLIVYTPAKYDYAENQKFEVIYVFDAQAREIFDMVQSTMAFKNNDICPMIVVGIVSSDRNKDFLPINEYKETFDKFNGHLGNADKFLSFVSDELVPFIDKKYRTLPKRIAVGHSNGGTFITYSFLQKPDLFDSYIAISPNFGYDKIQFVKRFKSFKPSNLTSDKFFYMCNSAGYPEEGDWIPARKQIADIFKSEAFSKKVIFKNQDFSASETHWSVFQIGVLNGLKEYFNYQYFNSDNLLKYYDVLYKKKLIDLNPQNANQLAYTFFYMGKPNDALKILLWAHQLFPKDLNLFDSIGEMYQNLNKKDEARKYYFLLDKNIEEQKGTLKADEYEQLKNGVKSRLNSLGNKK
jgi:predicted alpha/beta superfamily hydrolase